MDKPLHESWSSRMSYTLAAIAATVGLGNLWRFPVAAGENGGGAFIIIYILAVIAIAAPLFMAEVILGRKGRHSAPNTFRILAERTGRTPHWKWVGMLCLLTSMMVLSFYSVIAGISLAYIFKAASGVFVGASADAVSDIFSVFRGDPVNLLMWQAGFAVMTALIVARGLKSGLERAANILMPALFIILVLLVVYGAVNGDFAGALSYMFTVDFSAITAPVVLAAVGQAFFTMSIGSGGMLTYGAYLKKPIPIGRTTLTIAAGDTLVAMLAGLAIFPIVFANGLDPAEGAGLAFVTLPVAFGDMPLGSLVGVMFFVLFVFAAITSTIAILETVVAYFIEQGRGSRRKIVWLLTITYWIMGLATVLSFNLWADARPLDFIPALAHLDPGHIIDGLVANVFLLVVGALIALWVGWFLARDEVAAELGIANDTLFALWRFSMRYLAPGVVTVLFASNLV
jgi:neurotransmitter:Na+ symporter, NSS family